jgi:hypothetical protein
LSYGRFKRTLFLGWRSNSVTRLNSVFGLEKNGSETLQLIHQAYGDDAVRPAAVSKWWNRFRDGETNVKDEPLRGRLAQRLFYYPSEACGKRSAAHFREVGGAL